MKKYFVIFYIFILSNLLFAYSPWDPLINHLNSYFSYGKVDSFIIDSVENNSITFSLSNNTQISPGTELLIKKAGNNPLASPTVGFAKFLGVFNQVGSATIIFSIGNISQGDILLKPYNRKVILFTNVKDKYTFKPYLDIQQALTANNFTIYEINKPEEVNLLNPEEYNILVRLEVSQGLLIGKIQSLYDNSILYNQVYQFPFAVATNYPPNVLISLKQKQEIYDQANKFYAHGKRENLKFRGSKHDIHDYSFTTGRELSNTQLAMTGDYEILKYKLERKAVRMVAADTDGDKKQEFVILNKYGLYIYKINKLELNLVGSYPFTDSDIIPIHLHKGDFNKNGKEELFITLTKKIKDIDKDHNKLCSIILEYQGNNRFRIFNNNLEYYLRVVEDRSGKEHVICQKEGEYDPYKGAIYEMNWKGNSFVVGRPYPDAKNVYSIYGFLPHPDRKDYTLVIDRFGNIAGYYAPTEKRVELFEENMGIFNVITYPVKLTFDFWRGGYDRETARWVRAYRRLVYKKKYNKQVFTIKTPRHKDITRKVLSSIVGGSNEPDRIVGLKWVGNSIVKTWESDPFYGTIIDFSFLTVGRRDMLAVLTENSDEGFEISVLK